MTLKKFEVNLGKPYSQQLGRKTGKGAGHKRLAMSPIRAKGVEDARKQMQERLNKLGGE